MAILRRLTDLILDGAGNLQVNTAAQAPEVASGNVYNLWNTVAVLAAGTSTASTLSGTLRSWFITGNASAPTTITVQVSDQAGAVWRTTAIAQVLAGAGDFTLDCRTIYGSGQVRLLSSAAATITAGLIGSY